MASVAHASTKSAGTTAIPFMNMPNDAESIALGLASTARITSPSALSINPAGLGYKRVRALSFSHTEWIGALRNEQLGITSPIGPGTFAIQGQFLYDGDFLEVATGLNTTSKAQFSDMLLLGGYGAKFINRKKFDISAGASFYWARESLDGTAGSAFGARIGVQSRLSLGHFPKFGVKESKSGGLVRDLKIGMAVRNIGSKLNLGSTTAALPLSFVLGAEYMPIKYSTIIMETEIQKGEAPSFRIAAEILPFFMIKPRFGYNFGFGHTRFTTGLGVRFRSGPTVFHIDYATDPGANLGTSHWFTITFDHLGHAPDPTVREEIESTNMQKSPVPEEIELPTQAGPTNIVEPEVEIPTNIEPAPGKIIKPYLFVMPFLNFDGSGKYDFLSESLPSAVASEISHNSNLMVKRVSTSTFLSNSIVDNLREAGILDFLHYGQTTPADLILSGIFTRNSNGVFVRYEVYDTRKSIRISSRNAGGDLVFSLFDLIDEIVAGIREDVAKYSRENYKDGQK